jgi:glycosyltransferase involved in cell wall biosynthesis
MKNKFTLVMSGDDLRHPSGVSMQSRYIVEHLIKTGKFKIIYLGAAIKHPNFNPVKFEEFGDDFLLVPVQSYCPMDVLRQIIDIEHPDALWLMTDPRFYQHVFQNSNEIRKHMPILYNTIWDNADKETFPDYNLFAYQSVDFLGCINKATYEMMSWFPDPTIAMKSKYIPHGVPKDEYNILDLPQKVYKVKHFGEKCKNSFVLFYNSRNAHRKRTSNAVVAFKRFLDFNPGVDAFFAMHCSPHDPEGQDLIKIIEKFGIQDKVGFSTNRVENKIMAELYNAADATIQLSSEEGFGLAILESLQCGTPVICSRTGGMQDQAIDPDTGEVFGFCIEPAARTLLGSQGSTPYIWSDHVKIEDAAEAIQEIYEEFKVGNHKNKFAGERARQSMLRRFSLKDVQVAWENAIIDTIRNFRDKKEKSEVKMFSM